MSQSEDKLVTVVLLLKGRPEYTKRWLTYASLDEFPFKILIADGSLGNEAEQLLSDKNAFPNLDIEYVRYPPDVGRRDFYAKTADAVSRVKTPYLIKAANDDFYSVDGIRKSVAFLEEHPEYSGARGIIADFTLNPRGIPLPDQFVYGHIKHWEAFKAGRKFEHHELAADRVAAQCAYYITCWHDVNRASDAAVREAALLQCDPVDARVADHITDFLTVAAGPVYCGDYLYMFRQSNPRSSEGKKLIEQFKSQAEWVSSPWWKKDTENLYDVVGREISLRDRSSLESARTRFAAEYAGVYVVDLLERDNAPSSSLRTKVMRSLRAIARRVRIFVPIGRYLAGLRANANVRQARQTVKSLGWQDEADQVVRFLAKGVQ